jgi:hypothetical protein
MSADAAMEDREAPESRSKIKEEISKKTFSLLFKNKNIKADITTIIEDIISDPTAWLIFSINGMTASTMLPPIWSECACISTARYSRLGNNRRETVENKIMEAAKRPSLGEDSTFRLVSLGSGMQLQDFILCAKLLQQLPAGSTLLIISIDPMYESLESDSEDADMLFGLFDVLAQYANATGKTMARSQPLHNVSQLAKSTFQGEIHMVTGIDYDHLWDASGAPTEDDRFTDVMLAQQCLTEDGQLIIASNDDFLTMTRKTAEIQSLPKLMETAGKTEEHFPLKTEKPALVETLSSLESLKKEALTIVLLDGDTSLTHLRDTLIPTLAKNTELKQLNITLMYSSKNRYNYGDDESELVIDTEPKRVAIESFIRLMLASTSEDITVTVTMREIDKTKPFPKLDAQPDLTLHSACPKGRDQAVFNQHSIDIHNAYPSAVNVTTVNGYELCAEWVYDPSGNQLTLLKDSENNAQELLKEAHALDTIDDRREAAKAEPSESDDKQCTVYVVYDIPELYFGAATTEGERGSEKILEAFFNGEQDESIKTFFENCFNDSSRKQVPAFTNLSGAIEYSRTMTCIKSKSTSLFSKKTERRRPLVFKASIAESALSSAREDFEAPEFLGPHPCVPVEMSVLKPTVIYEPSSQERQSEGISVSQETAQAMGPLLPLLTLTSAEEKAAACSVEEISP